MQCQAQGLRAQCGQFGGYAARTGTECRAEGTGTSRPHAAKRFQSRALHTLSTRKCLDRRRVSDTKDRRAYWKHRADWFQLRDTGNVVLQKGHFHNIKLCRRVAAALQPGGSGATAGHVSRPEDVSSSKEAVEESPEAVSWVRRKWAENRAEYERLRGVLKDLGLAGFLSYGLFNTGYYLVSFLFVWFFVSPSPGGLGIAPAAKRFIRIFAMVWAGSQVTKLLRAGGCFPFCNHARCSVNSTTWNRTKRWPKNECLGGPSPQFSPPSIRKRTSGDPTPFSQRLTGYSRHVVAAPSEHPANRELSGDEEALLLAPLVDRGLDWFTAKCRFRSKSQAFWTIVGSCIALALVIFVVIVSLWA